VELRRCELAEASNHVRYLMAYMAEGFMARGGDYEAVQVLLLIPR
jgi:dynactin 1